jgi:murein L,D-transpeptidase YafK
MVRRLAVLWGLSGLLAASVVAEQADHIIISKSERQMVLQRRGKVLKTYKVALGKKPVGPKMRQGDLRTPEGVYVIDGRYPQSEYHMALHISYPNAADRARARQLGVAPGGDILIHGLPADKGSIGKADPREDWTMGCVAVTDQEIEEIYHLVPNGTVVEIRP